MRILKAGLLTLMLGALKWLSLGVILSALCVVSTVRGADRPQKPTPKMYDVTKHGAKGDGKTDDTRAISEVITKAAGTGATVFFPAGTYLVLNLPIASRITLAGDPREKAILKLNHRAIMKRGCIIMYTEDRHIDQLVIRDLNFDGDRHNIPGDKLAQLVNIFWLRDSQVINCEFYNGKGGVIFQRRVSNLRLENCTVRDTDAIGFYIQNGKDITLINCHSIRNKSAYGIFEVDYLALKGCTGMYSTSGHIQIDASRHVKYINCVSAHNRGKGFNIMASHFRTGKPPHDILYENCVAHDNGEEGFNMCGAHNVALKNYKSYNNRDAGVAMATIDSLKSGELMDSVTVTGCEIRDNGKEAIVVNGARNCTFSGNRIYGNGRETSGKYNAISINAASKIELPVPEPLRRGSMSKVTDVWHDDVARVTLNGKTLGTVWSEPCRVSIPAGLLRSTGNQLKIDVANVWQNRLLGDWKEPDDREARTLQWENGMLEGKAYPTGRYTFSTMKVTKGRLLPSGLLGPVQILTVKK